MVTNEDRIAALMIEANPVPDYENIEVSAGPTAYLVALSQRSSDMTQLDTKQPRTPHAKRSRTPWLAAAGLIAAVGVTILVTTQANENAPVTDEPTPTTLVESAPTTVAEAPPTTVAVEETVTTVAAPLDPKVEEGLSIATAYTEALMAGDLATANGLALDSVVPKLLGVSNASVGARGEVPWQEALGWAATLDECVVIGTDPARPRVTCTLSHSTDISRALGVDSFNTTHTYTIMYEGGTFFGQAITQPTIVSDGTENDTSTNSTGYVGFKREVFDPFITWLQATHLDDLEQVMWHATAFGVVSPDRWLTGDFMPDHAPESVDLWHLYSAEYIDQLGG